MNSKKGGITKNLRNKGHFNLRTYFFLPKFCEYSLNGEQYFWVKFYLVYYDVVMHLYSLEEAKTNPTQICYVLI